MTTYKHYALRTCRPGGVSRKGFTWSLTPGARNTAPDWSLEPKCGGGLHGLLNGEGDGELADWRGDDVWLCIGTDADVVELGGKVKAQWWDTIAAGTRGEAIAALDAATGGGYAVIGATRTAGYKGTATAGYKGTATAGYKGTATAGDDGTATAGRHGTATAGRHGAATAGDDGIILIRYWTGTRYKVAVAYPGEDGIKANTPYRVEVRNGEPVFVEAK